MREIAEQLKQAREKIGITINEVAEDLKLNPSDLMSIEEVDKTAIKDILDVKQIISKYAKYLGLEVEKIEDEFNEFIFEYTSKIPLEEIADKNKQSTNQPKKIVSPYTTSNIIKNRKTGIPVLIILILIIIFIIYYIF